MHSNHDSNEENAENSKVSEKSLPLCFSSFQFLRENYKQEDKQVVSSIMGKNSYYGCHLRYGSCYSSGIAAPDLQ